MLRTAPNPIGPRAGNQILGRLLSASVEMAERAVVAAGSGPRTDAAPPLVGEKVRGEAAMLLRSAWHLGESVSGLSATLTRLAEELAVNDLSRFGVQLCLNPGVALDLALVPLHLRDLGVGDERLEPLLKATLSPDTVGGPERPPHRELEQLWLRGLWVGEVDATGVAQALASSCLARDFDHLSGATDDAYAFTHAVLYATDHGRKRVELPRAAEEIEADAEAILAVALDAGNHDVAAEVLWTWPMLGIAWSPLAEEARQFLGQVCDARGFLPGPGFDSSVHNGLPAAERNAYVVQTSYHTTLVHGMLVAAVASQGAFPKAAPSSAAPAERLPGRLFDLLPPSQVARDWWGYVAALPPVRSAALESAVVTMALRRAVATADLFAVAKVVRHAAETQLAHTPPLRQARRLLAQAVVCAELAAGH